MTFQGPMVSMRFPVVPSSMTNVHGCYKNQQCKHWFCSVLPPWQTRRLWRCHCKNLCTEICVAVCYLNVSGLQSGRHSNKENMFWTACFCLWLWLCAEFLPSLTVSHTSVKHLQTACTLKTIKHKAISTFIHLDDVKPNIPSISRSVWL